MRLARASVGVMMLWALASNEAAAQGATRPDIVVIRPSAAPPHDVVFDAITEGISSERERIDVAEIVIEDATTPSSLAGQLARAHPDAVITLGRKANDLYAASRSSAPQIVGGLDVPPGKSAKKSGVALSADPAFILGRLKAILPKAQRLIVVYDPAHDQWLIERAKKVAGSFDLSVDAYRATTIAEASTHYWNIIRYANPDTDVLWLVGNPALIGESNLPRIIEESWRRSFPVVSNSLDHVRSGVLLATYPDLTEMGRQLAIQAAEVAEAPDTVREIEPLAAVRFAVNERIAGHLGLDLTEQDKRSFDLVLGERP